MAMMLGVFDDILGCLAHRGAVHHRLRGPRGHVHKEEHINAREERYPRPRPCTLPVCERCTAGLGSVGPALSALGGTVIGAGTSPLTSALGGTAVGAGTSPLTSACGQRGSCCLPSASPAAAVKAGKELGRGRAVTELPALLGSADEAQAKLQVQLDGLALYAASWDLSCRWSGAR